MVAERSESWTCLPTRSITEGRARRYQSCTSPSSIAPRGGPSFTRIILYHSRLKIFTQANILVSSSLHAVLCDFGLSRIASDTTSRISAVDAAMIEGSLNWMAPERLEGTSKPRPSADIYSLGVTMWEVRTSLRPHSGPSTLDADAVDSSTP